MTSTACASVEDTLRLGRAVLASLEVFRSLG